HECVLDSKIPSSWNISNEVGVNICGISFERYLYALGTRANKTGEIFLNITEQNDCLNTKNTSCGIERLTSGNGGCSDYSVTDVINNLGIAFKNLEENCKNLGLNINSDKEYCSSCLGTWDQMNGSYYTGEKESDVCRFSVLISLTSQRINDVGWIQSIYSCLGNGKPIADQARKEVKKIHFVTVLEFLIGGAIVISLIVAIVSIILFKRTTKEQPSKEINAFEDSFSEKTSEVMISLKEVYLATNNLSASNFIGQGVAGKVYKGVLSNGQRVAMKHIINDGQMETFVREVTSLSHVKHPNLVELLGHCDGEDESFLVYELCDNGNLSEWLFGKHKFLTWLQRLEIAIDCARGLWFLHTYPQGCIVHRDIKPTNILLGSDFQAKLSDFGLSKVICMGLSYVSSEVRGTFGYVDPEYQKNHHVNSSTDVYSFGIVLLQLISGQRVINLDVNRPMPLSRVAKNLTKGGDITQFVDQKLNGEYEVEAFELIFRLALSCTRPKQQRPSMEKVVAVLEKAHRISGRVRSIDHSFQSL
ncbi:hypothetical protein RD792_004628, partial [Penstemon davidsonii]